MSSQNSGMPFWETKLSPKVSRELVFGTKTVSRDLWHTFGIPKAVARDPGKAFWFRKFVPRTSWEHDLGTKTPTLARGCSATERKSGLETGKSILREQNCPVDTAGETSEEAGERSRAFRTTSGFSLRASAGLGKPFWFTKLFPAASGEPAEVPGKRGRAPGRTISLSENAPRAAGRQFCSPKTQFRVVTGRSGNTETQCLQGFPDLAAIVAR